MLNNLLEKLDIMGERMGNFRRKMITYKKEQNRNFTIENQNAWSEKFGTSLINMLDIVKIRNRKCDYRSTKIHLIYRPEEDTLKKQSLSHL